MGPRYIQLLSHTSLFGPQLVGLFDSLDIGENTKVCT